MFNVKEDVSWSLSKITIDAFPSADSLYWFFAETPLGIIGRALFNLNYIYKKTLKGEREKR